VADELAARTVGAKAWIDGLHTVHRVSPAFQAYWEHECAPVLNAGFRPPLTEGFQKFVSRKKVAEEIDKLIEEALQEGKADPYDSHPPLKERIAAVEGITGGETFVEDPPAITLLEDVTSLELELVVTLAGPDQAAKLKSISWDNVRDEVYLPKWRKLVEANASVLQGVKVADLPARLMDFKTFSRQFKYMSGEDVSWQDAESVGGAVLGAAMVVLLQGRGAAAQSEHGDALELNLNGVAIQPFNVISELREGKLTPEEWTRMTRELGIADDPLAAS
jgi:hypothetical protein